MEFPLTPLEFARRARKLHPHREAVAVPQLGAVIVPLNYRLTAAT